MDWELVIVYRAFWAAKIVCKGVEISSIIVQGLEKSDSFSMLLKM